MKKTDFYISPIGLILLESDGESLIRLDFTDETCASELKSSSKELLPKETLEVFSETKRWLDIYFSGRKPDFTPPLSMKTTAFRKAVWKIMLKIPYGHTMTYGEIADKIAKQKNIARMSAQAVGGAVAHNPVSLIIPCHRVVGTNGSLTGYAGGIDKKIKLLTMEKADMSSFFIPKKGTAL